MRRFVLYMIMTAVVPALMCGCGSGAVESFAAASFPTEEETAAGLDDPDQGQKESDPGTGGEAGDVLCVDISGAVTEPGVYVLPAGSRVVDAVEAASGLRPEADLARLNQARELTDGEKIIVCAVGEEIPSGAAESGGAVSTGNVNINTADPGELVTLSGIGEVKARAIVEDRERNGAFQDPGDIMRVTGIGEKLFERIRDEITV